ncbi:MAG: clostripain-related cysteine peptidase [bacterium]
MNIKKYLKIIFLFLLFFTQQAFSIADWTILIYVQAKNNLNRFAAQNLQSMSQIGSSANLNILVQWYQPGQEGIWRYKILKNKIELDTYIQTDSDGSNTKDLVDSMRWATTNYPAKNNFLILWNHGVGILDPVWSKKTTSRTSFREENFAVDLSENSKDNLYVKLDGILTDDFSFTQDFDPSSLRHRGILFNEQSRTYLNNQELVEALRQIKTDILKNKKLDIFGMDACLMAMVEVGYQVKDFAQYMVGSQEVELAYGWDYLTLFKSMQTGNTTPLELAKGIVLTYEQFYKNRINFYTQSAIKLETMDSIKDTLNDIAIKTEECKKHDIKAMKNIIMQARNKSLQFSTRSYIDLYSFYSELLKILNNYQTPNNALTTPIKNLKSSIQAGMNAINTAVVAKTAGPNLSVAKGLSVYFPKGRIDNSYFETSFAKETLWLNLIKDIY